MIKVMLFKVRILGRRQWANCLKSACGWYSPLGESYVLPSQEVLLIHVYSCWSILELIKFFEHTPNIFPS